MDTKYLHSLELLIMHLEDIVCLFQILLLYEDFSRKALLTNKFCHLRRIKDGVGPICLFLLALIRMILPRSVPRSVAWSKFKYTTTTMNLSQTFLLSYVGMIVNTPLILIWY